MISIALEGLEGAGKSTLALALCEFFADVGYFPKLVAEFSDSRLGSYLHGRLRDDRFLGDPRKARTAFTQLLSVAADTAWSIEYELAESASLGAVRVKDRYRESVVACQSYALHSEYGLVEEHAYLVAKSVAVLIPDVADYVFWLETPSNIRLQRLEAREGIEERDGIVYAFRERQYRRLMTDPEWPWRAIDLDGTRSVPELVHEVGQIVIPSISPQRKWEDEETR